MEAAVLVVCGQRLISGLLGDKELMKERKAPPPQQQQQPGPASPPPSAPKIPAIPPESPPGARSDPPLRLPLGQEVLRDPPAHRKSLKCSFFKVREKKQNDTCRILCIAIDFQITLKLQINVPLEYQMTKDGSDGSCTAVPQA